jgi:hypothetical protein
MVKTMVLKWVIMKSQNLKALLTNFEATMEDTNMNIRELHSLSANHGIAALVV